MVYFSYMLYIMKKKAIKLLIFTEILNDYRLYRNIIRSYLNYQTIMIIQYYDNFYSKSSRSFS